jgi:hypothetical protein
MKNLIGYLSALSLASLPLAAQEHRDGQTNREGQNNNRGAQPNRAGQGEGARNNAPVGRYYIPSRGPAPVRSAVPPVHVGDQTQRGQSDPQHHAYRDQPSHPEIPHVHPQGDQWVGHTTGRNDPRYRVSQPWAHGHFTGGFGPRYVYRLGGGSTERFAIDGNYFSVAPADDELASDWDWNNDNIVLYADPDHDGFYLAYNSRLGTYAHVEYLGG